MRSPASRTCESGSSSARCSGAASRCSAHTTTTSSSRRTCTPAWDRAVVRRHASVRRGAPELRRQPLGRHPDERARCVVLQASSATHDDRERGVERRLAAARAVSADARRPRGGMRGYSGAEPGGQRAITRLEERWYSATFAATPTRAWRSCRGGRVWAGDVPFGQTIANEVRRRHERPRGAAAGLEAALAGGLMLPLDRARGAQLELRLRTEDGTRIFWREPRDVERSRERTVPRGYSSGGSRGAEAPQQPSAISHQLETPREAPSLAGVRSRGSS